MTTKTKNTSDTVRVGLDLPTFNPKKKKKKPDSCDYADEYIIRIERNDGEGISEEEARSVMFAYLLRKRGRPM